MTNDKFQVGDKIKAGPFTADLGLTPGNVYTVHHVDDFGLVQPDGVRHHHFHPSHFKLVERAASTTGRYGVDPDLPCYSLKDGEGDWWVYETEDPRAMGAWHLVADPHVTREGTDEGVDSIADIWGIDAEPLPSVAGAEVPDSCSECASYDPNTGLHWDTCPNRGSVHLGSADPAPLQPGEWVQVWAQIDGPGNSEKNTYIRIHAETTRAVTGAWVRNDAIVRPAEGQTPPWVQVATERVAMIAKTLMSEGGMDHDAAFKAAESLDRAGVRVTEGGAA